jgi:hypothetical protein
MKPTKYQTSDRGELVDLGAVFDNEVEASRAPVAHSVNAPWAKQSTPPGKSEHERALIDGWLHHMLGESYHPWKERV